MNLDRFDVADGRTGEFARFAVRKESGNVLLG
jgi:hypothetical protein